MHPCKTFHCIDLTRSDHGQDLVAKRGRTNRANVQTFKRSNVQTFKKSFKTHHSRIPINPAILAAIGHRFIAQKKKKKKKKC